MKDWLARNRIPGRVRYYGCPAEEGGAAKAFMVRAGAFGTEHAGCGGAADAVATAFGSPSTPAPDVATTAGLASDTGNDLAAIASAPRPCHR